MRRFRQAANRLALERADFGATRPPIGKALPANADQRAIGTHFVTVAKRNAMAVAEIELGKVR